MKMIKAVREGRDSCSDLSWVFRLDRMGPRMAGVDSMGGSWVVAGDDDCAVCVRRLSGVTLDVTPTEKKSVRSQGKISVVVVKSNKRVNI